MNKILVSFILFFLISCSSELKLKDKPKNLISKDSMVVLLKDLSILESHINLKYPQIQTSYKTIINSSELIFKKYNIDTNRFNSSMEYYIVHQKDMQAIYSQVLDSINREITELSTSN